MLTCRCPICLFTLVRLRFKLIIILLLLLIVPPPSPLRFVSGTVASASQSLLALSPPQVPSKPSQFRNISFILNGPSCECDTPLLFEQLLENTVNWFENRTNTLRSFSRDDSGLSTVFENSRFQTIVYRTCTDQQYVSLQTNRSLDESSGGGGGGGDDDANGFLIEPLIFEPELLLKALQAFLNRLQWTTDLYVVCDDLSFRNILAANHYYDDWWSSQSASSSPSIFFCISEMLSFRNLLSLNVTQKIQFSSSLILIGTWKQLTIAANYLNLNFQSITDRFLYLPIDGFQIQNIANNSYYIETTTIEANNPKNIFNAIFLKIVESLITKLTNSTTKLKYSEIVRKFELNEEQNNRFVFYLMRNGAKLIAFDLIANKIRTWTNPLTNKTFDNEKFATKSVFLLPAYCISVRSDRIWIWIMLTLGFLGFSISLLIIAYVVKKICERIIFEGSPLLSVLLLIGVCLMYLAVLPFAIECPLCCGWKIGAIAFARHFVLALIFARLVLLASITNADISLHVSGFVLTVLILFEIALSAVLISFSVTYLCPTRIFHAYQIQIVYDSILLTAVFLLAPFVYTCRRNYNESFYFAICSLLLVFNRIATIFVFVRYDQRSDWIDPILAYSLLSDATIILGVIFVPRTYLINVAEVKEIILASTLSQSDSKLPIRGSNSFETSYIVPTAATNPNLNSSTDF